MPENEISNNLLRRLRTAGLAAIATSLLIACTHDEASNEEIAAAQQTTIDNQWGILKSRGLLGRHELSFMQASSEVQTHSESQASVNGDLDAFYFLVVGGADGNLSGSAHSESSTQTVRSIRLAWESTSEQPFTTISEFPIEILKIVEEEGIETPAIKFEVNLNSLVYLGDRSNSACFWDPDPGTGKDPGYHPENCMYTTDFATPNEFLAKSGFLKSVIMYLDPQDASELYAQISAA